MRVWDLGAKMGGMFAHGGELGGEENQTGDECMRVVRCVLKSSQKGIMCSGRGTVSKNRGECSCGGTGALLKMIGNTVDGVRFGLGRGLKRH